MIKIESLTVQFGGVRPLEALDGEFKAPICGLIGPNGAGKTTLLNVLSGFVTPIQGSVSLDDVPLRSLSPVRRVAAGLRRTFQQELVVDDYRPATTSWRSRTTFRRRGKRRGSRSTGRWISSA